MSKNQTENVVNQMPADMLIHGRQAVIQKINVRPRVNGPC